MGAFSAVLIPLLFGSALAHVMGVILPQFTLQVHRASSFGGLSRTRSGCAVHACNSGTHTSFAGQPPGLRWGAASCPRDLPLVASAPMPTWRVACCTLTCNRTVEVPRPAIALGGFFGGALIFPPRIVDRHRLLQHLLPNRDWCGARPVGRVRQVQDLGSLVVC